MSESQQQATVVEYFNLKYKEYKIHSIPNGTHIKSHQGRNKAKREGLLSGVSDLFIPVPRGQYHGFYLEMKDIGKKIKDVTPRQKEFIIYARWQGYWSDWFNSADKAIKAIDDYMNMRCEDEDRSKRK